MRAITLTISLITAVAMAGCGSTRQRDPDPDADTDSDVGDECSNSGHCPSDEVCVRGYCEAAYDRIYRVGITGVNVSRAHNPDNDPWEDDETAPDLYVCLVFGYGDDLEEHCTDPVIDSHEPRYGMWAVETTIAERRPLEVTLCDEDPGEPECWVVAEMSAIPLTSLRAETITLLPDDPARLDDYSVTLSFLPL